MEVLMAGSQMSKLGTYKDTMKGKTQILEWKTHRCTSSVGWQCVSIRNSTSGRDRVQRTTRLLRGTRWWLHNPDSHSNCQGTIIHFEKLLNENGMRSLIPVHLEKEALNFYLNRGVKSEEIHSVNDAKKCLENSRNTSKAE